MRKDKVDKMKSKLQDLIERGFRLKEKDLMEGYEAFRDWRQDCLTFIEAHHRRFQFEVESPLHIECGIRILETTFASDE